MNILRALRFFQRQLRPYKRGGKSFTRYVNNAISYLEGVEYGTSWEIRQTQDQTGRGLAASAAQAENPLFAYFHNNRRGQGIWKWEHYFDAYHRHFSKFVGQPADVLEIGIYSGGSLSMWRSYFGPQSRIYGIDIEPACKAYEREGVTVVIGDQQDRAFWRGFKSNVPGIDVLIDDGGHSLAQQKVTLEEMLPHLRPGGVYLCEDLHGTHHELVTFATGLISELNRADAEGRSVPTPLQRSIHSLHFYPYLLVIEKRLIPLDEFLSTKRGTEWQPFFDEPTNSRQTPFGAASPNEVGTE